MVYFPSNQATPIFTIHSFIFISQSIEQVRLLQQENAEMTKQYEDKGRTQLTASATV